MKFRHHRGRPSVEALEARALLTSVVVNTVIDGTFSLPTVSLRNAINAANASSTPTTITFDPAVFSSPQTIVLNGNDLHLNNRAQATTIVGPAAGVTISGNHKGRVFLIDNDATVSMSRLTVTQGNANAPGFDGWGGGFDINNDTNAGVVTLDNVTVAGNTASQGGGINSGGVLKLTNVTISKNIATGDNGGIRSIGIATLGNSTVAGNSSAGQGGGIGLTGSFTLTNVTVSGNSAGNSGGGIYNFDAATALTIENSIVAGNSAANGGPDVFNPINSLGYNLVGKTDGSIGWNGFDRTGTVASPLDAKLGSLANNGGLGQTMAPLAGSPAIDHGNNAYVPNGVTTDERGLPRIVNGTVDIGAAEVQAGAAVSLQLTGPANQSATQSQAATVQLGSFTQSNASGPFKATISWGDTMPATIIPLTAAGRIPPTAHAFSISGALTVSVTIADSKGVKSNPVAFTETVAPTPGVTYIANPSFETNAAWVASSHGGQITGSYINTWASQGSRSYQFIRTTGGTTVGDYAQISQTANLTGVRGIVFDCRDTGIDQELLQFLVDGKVAGQFSNEGWPIGTVVDVGNSANWGHTATNTNIKIAFGSIYTGNHTFTIRMYQAAAYNPADTKIMRIDNIRPITLPTASITGNVFSDTSADGKQESGEKGLAGTTVYIDSNKNGKFDSGEMKVTSDSQGNYKFAGLSAGSYRIAQVLPTGYGLIAPAGGHFDITLAAGGVSTGNVFADVPPTASISGQVFNDTNNDGKRELPELGLGLWTLYIDSNNNGKLDANELKSTTDITGKWAFTSLGAGTYVVRVVPVAGTTATKPTGNLLSIKLTAGQQSAGNLFGEVGIA